MANHTNARDKYIGKTYYHLLVVDYIPHDYINHKHARVVCLCDCGTITEKFASGFGRVKTCGCGWPYSKHRMSNTPEYNVWRAMLDRCFNSNNKQFHNYGGRGITIHPDWLGKYGFSNFFAHVGYRPDDSYSIDRINNNGNYEPGNVKWSTSKEQNRNRRGIQLLTYNNETLCIEDWAKRLGITATSLSLRIKRGWSINKALSTPKYHTRQNLSKEIH